MPSRPSRARARTARRTGPSGSQHRADARVQKALRDAAEEHACDAAVAVRAHDDQVCSDLACDCCDGAGGVAGRACADDEGRVDAAAAGAVDLPADRLPQLGLVREHRIAAAAPDEDLADVGDDERRLVGLGQPEREGKRPRGRLGAVGRPEDCLEHECSFRVDSTIRPAGGDAIGGRPDVRRGFSAAFEVPFGPWQPSPERRTACAPCSRRACRSPRICRSSRCSSGSSMPPPTDRGAVCRTRRDRPEGTAARALRDRRNRRRDAPRDRRPAPGPGDPRSLIAEAAPLRLHDLCADPRSAGFPANHPPMHTFLGVPILLRGVAYGNFYLTEKAGGEDFTEDDQEMVSLLASQAAVAIENARLYEASTRWSKQLESLNEIGNALATETDVGRLLDLVSRRLQELLERPARRGDAPCGRQRASLRGRRRRRRRGLPRAGDAARSLEERQGLRARPGRAERLRSRRPRRGSGRRARPRGAHGSVGPARRSLGDDRPDRRPRQARGRYRASPTPTFALQRPSPLALRSRSTSPSASPGTRSGGSSTRRSLSGAASRANCTTRPGRRSPRSCSA